MNQVQLILTCILAACAGYSNCRATGERGTTCTNGRGGRPKEEDSHSDVVQVLLVALQPERVAPRSPRVQYRRIIGAEDQRVMVRVRQVLRERGLLRNIIPEKKRNGQSKLRTRRCEGGGRGQWRRKDSGRTPGHSWGRGCSGV